MGTHSPAVRFLATRLPWLRLHSGTLRRPPERLLPSMTLLPGNQGPFSSAASGAMLKWRHHRETGASVADGSRQTIRGAATSCKSRTASSGERAAVSDTAPDPEERAEAVRGLLARYRSKYFSEGQPEVSDDVYDSLQRELERLEAHLGAGEGDEGRPSSVGAPPLERLEKAPHRVPMLSLAAVGSLEELQAWRQRLDNYVASSAFQQSQGAAALMTPESLLGACQWVVEPKVDGLAVRLTYLQGQLAQAATRGDGSVGEDVTHNAFHIRGLPLSLPGTTGDIEVRGEVFISKEDYKMINDAQEAAGEERFASPRNAAAGSLRLLDPEASRGRRLSFVAYQLLFYGDNHDQPRDSHWETLQWLEAAGFSVSPDNALASTFEEATAAAEAWMAGRDSLGYEVDGAVLKVDGTAARDALGSIGGDPRWAVAWKFPAAQATTRLLGIDMSLGRTGQLTPVAILDPVAIGGVSVGRASLHNVGLVAKLGLMIGDTVVVERAGDVIPQVVAAIPELRSGSEETWERPKLCPACSSAIAVVRENDADIARCLNSLCPGQAERLLQYFVSTCVKGVGDAAVSQLIEAGLVTNVLDLYDLTAEQFESLEGFRDRRARNHKEAIQRTRGMPVATALVGLGIPLVGRKAAKALEAEFGTLARLCTASEEELAAIDGFGPKMAASVRQWCEREPNRRLLEGLRDRGVVSEKEVKRKPDEDTELSSSSSAAAASYPSASEPSTSKVSEQGSSLDGSSSPASPLSGMSVVITGTFQSESPDTGKRISRAEAGALVEAHGGRVVSAVSAKTGIVVAAAKPGKSKLEAASRLGVRVVDEAGFWQLLKSELDQ